MGDEEIFPDEDISTGGGGDDGSGKKFGFLPAIVISILKWVALALGAVVFIVTVVVITVSILNRGQAGALPAGMSEDVVATGEILAWYDGIEEVRTRTNDTENNTVIVKIKLGYEMGDKAVQSDLIQRQPPLQAMVRAYFAGKKAEELKQQNETQITSELRERLNRQLSNPRSIKEVIIISMSVISL